jgi:hypothetical protein
MTVNIKSAKDALNTLYSTAAEVAGNSDYSSGDGGLRIWGGDNSLNNTNISGKNFGTLYSGNYNIELGTDAHEKNKAGIVSRLDDLGQFVINALADHLGLDKSILNLALPEVNTKWKSSIADEGNVGDSGCNKSDQRTKAGSSYRSLSDKVSGQSGIYRGKDTKGNNQEIYMINFKAYVDAIIEAYNTKASTPFIV